MEAAVTRLPLILSVLALLGQPAVAQDLAALERAESALRDAWTQLPLTLRDVAFVTAVEGYGVYTPRPDAVFRSADVLGVYAEPLGYDWQASGDEWRFGLEVDLVLLSSVGDVILEVPAFATSEISSRVRNTEFHMLVTVNLTNAPVGEYLLGLRFVDIISRQAVETRLPFEVRE